MVIKIGNLASILLFTGACAFGGEVSTNSIPDSSRVCLSAIYGAIPRVPSYSCEKTTSFATNILNSASHQASEAYRKIVREGRDISELVVNKAREVLSSSSWNVSVRKSNYGEKESSEFSVYYSTGF